MAAASALEGAVDWRELLQARRASTSESSLDSYSSTCLSDSLGGSMSGSLGDLALPPPAVLASATGPSVAVSRCNTAAAPSLAALQAVPFSLGMVQGPAGHAAPLRHVAGLHSACLSQASSCQLSSLDNATSTHLVANLNGLAASASALSAAGSLHPGSPAGSPARSVHSGGPAPEVLLAALSASLAARQGQQQQDRQRRPQAGPAPPAGWACSCCSAVFADEAGYNLHCASLEHAMAVVNGSLVGGLAGVAAQPQAPALGHGALGAAGAGWASAAGGDRQAPSLSVPAGAASMTCRPLSRLGALVGNSSLGLHAAPLPAGLPAAVPGYAFPAAPTAPYSITSCCDQVIDPQMDLAAHTLLKQLRQLDGVERAVGTHAAPRGGGKLPRRLVGGLREVRKAVRSGTAVAVVAAVDIQETNPCATPRRFAVQPGADISEIVQIAQLCGVPVVFALTRLGLGSIFGSNKRMSAVAITNGAGLEAPLQHLLSMAAVGRARFAALVGHPRVA